MSKLKGVWVDGLLWENKDFLLIEKHLLQKLKDLDNEEGCTAMNGWLAGFLGVSKSRVSQLISRFKKDELIKVELKYKGKEVVGRVINILKGGMLLFKGGVYSTNTPLSYTNYPPLADCEVSNIELSNLLKEYKEREKEALTKIEFLESELKKTKLALKTFEEKEPKESSEKEKVIPPPTAEYNHALKKKAVRPKKKGDWTQLDTTLHNFTLPESWSIELQEKVLEYWQYMDGKKGANWGTTQTVIRQRDAVINHLKKYSAKEIIEALEETMLNGNASYNPSWTKNRKEKELKDKPKPNQNEDGTPSYMMGLQ